MNGVNFKPTTMNKKEEIIKNIIGQVIEYSNGSWQELCEDTAYNILNNPELIQIVAEELGMVSKEELEMLKEQMYNQGRLYGETFGKPTIERAVFIPNSSTNGIKLDNFHNVVSAQKEENKVLDELEKWVIEMVLRQNSYTKVPSTLNIKADALLTRIQSLRQSLIK